MDTQEELLLAREALDLHPQGHPGRASSLNSLALCLFTRYKQLGGVGNLNEAIVLEREALDLLPQGHPDHALFSSNLAVYLSTRYTQLGGIDDLNEAIILAREALVLSSKGHPGRALFLNTLAVCLSTRYKQLGGMGNLDEAILLAREALDLSTQDYPARRASFSDNLAMCLCTRYTQLGGIGDLNEAIALGRDAFDLSSQGHPDRALLLHNLSQYLFHRYRQVVGTCDLNEAIVLGREVLDLSSQGHPDRVSFLGSLALHLFARYRQLGRVGDGNDAIALGREALDLSTQGHLHRALLSSSLSAYLQARYFQLGGIGDLNEAIAFGREALDLSTQGHPNRALFSNNLALCLSTRYKQLGEIGDLNESIVLGREALVLSTQGHPDRALFSNNLASYISTRYKQLGGIGDLNEAIVLGREALNLLPQGHSDRASSLSNLTTYLLSRYTRLGGTSDLNEAVVLGRESLGLFPQGHPNRALSSNNLAYCLSTGYTQFGGIGNLNEAITLGREALDLHPQGHPDRALSLNNLAMYLFERYKQLGGIDDLNEAIILGQEALDLFPRSHRTLILDNLGQCLRNRFMHTNESEDRQNLFNLYSELADIGRTMVSSTDLFAARSWVDAAEEFAHTTTLLAYETSLRLLVQHLATLPSLPEYLPILKRHTSSLAVDAFSACLRHDYPQKAVELLEQGRGVFWNQISRLRSPLDDVIASGPEGKILADKFTRLTSLVRDAINSPSPEQHDLVYRLNFEMDEVVTNIRNLPGLERFLLPLFFSDLQRAAACGPVIIVNASRHSRDALIVFAHQDPAHIPLQISKDRVLDLASEVQSLTSSAEMMDMSRNLALVLRELWDEVVSPIVDFLQTTLPVGSRIWWCPTAEFSLLPLHAAGPYRPGRRNLSHFYVSSYTPTLSALIRARRHSPSSSVVQNKRFVAIGQAQASGERELVSVGDELDIVCQRIKEVSTFTRVEGPESSITCVSEELTKNEWVHFACHGLPDRQRPFDSAFALHDGHFTIQHIIKCELEHAEFAYLSACHTTVGDEESPDEIIHLASAMQFAGFRSVIGTMWAVDDTHTHKITSEFYENVLDESGRLDYTRAAFALNRTMERVNIPFDQRILYVHIGA